MRDALGSVLAPMKKRRRRAEPRGDAVDAENATSREGRRIVGRQRFARFVRAPRVAGLEVEVDGVWASGGRPTTRIVCPSPTPSNARRAARARRGTASGHPRHAFHRVISRCGRHAFGARTGTGLTDAAGQRRRPGSAEPLTQRRHAVSGRKGGEEYGAVGHARMTWASRGILGGLRGCGGRAPAATNLFIYGLPG